MYVEQGNLVANVCDMNLLSNAGRSHRSLAIKIPVLLELVQSHKSNWSIQMSNNWIH